MTKEIQLDEAVGKLEEALAAEIRAEKRSIRTTRVIMGAIVLIAVTFVVSNYVHFKGEWTEDNLTQSAQAQWEELRPAATAELQTLGKNVGPVYAKELRKQLPHLAPQVGHALRVQSDHFLNDLSSATSSRLEATMDRTMQRAATDMVACYPELRNGIDNEKRVKQYREMLGESFAEAMTEFDWKFKRDATTLQDTVMNVPSTSLSKRDLAKRFARLWVQWLDEEIRKQ